MDGKTNDDMPDFEQMMNEAEHEVEADKAEQELVDRIPQLKQFGKDVDLVTNTFINSTLELENVIHMYLHAETKLDSAVTRISGKVDTVNTHIDNVLKQAPTKLKVSVEVRSEDWQKIEKMFDEHNKKILGMMQGHINKVNDMFADERKKVRERYKEYDGVYLGRYAQWFVGTFFCLGFFGFCMVISMMIAKHNGW